MLGLTNNIGVLYFEARLIPAKASGKITALEMITSDPLVGARSLIIATFVPNLLEPPNLFILV